MNRPLKPARPEKPAEPLQSEPAPAEDRAHALLADLERVTSVVKHELARSAPTGSSASEATEPASEQADVESLESYLDRFMERMTGKKPATAALAETQPLPRTPQVTEILPPPPPPPPREPAAAPERREQLTALRQVANQNARNAVILHDCQGLMVQTRTLLAGACGASCLSSGLAILALAGNSSWARLSAVVTCLLAVVLSCWFFGLYRRLRGRAGQLQTDE